MRKIVLLFTSLVIILVIFGCSSSVKLTQPDAKTSKKSGKTGIINENFDPSLLDENKLELKKTISPESKSDSIDDLLLQTSEKVQMTKELDGFKVQICAVSDEKKAMQVRRDAIIRLINEDVYMDYHAPYYKVRIGNCLTRYEAEQLQQLVIQKGFADAWVVRTKVKSRVKKEESPQQQNDAPQN